MFHLTGLLPGLGPLEMTVVLILGILLFARRLPDVGRYLRKGWQEFSKGRSHDEAESADEPLVAESPALIVWIILVCYVIALLVFGVALKLNSGG